MGPLSTSMRDVYTVIVKTHQTRLTKEDAWKSVMGYMLIINICPPYYNDIPNALHDLSQYI